MMRDERADAFLRTADLYRLGHLTTEQPHPLTRDLSRWAREDLARAVAALVEVDHLALARLAQAGDGLEELGRAVRETLRAGRRVFLCGCGATGRLSLTLESLWRRRCPGDDRVHAFMAGGDVALVHALEGFEDHPEFGRRHLAAMGFAEGDLLIASTEGGETPFVIGATEAAAEVSSRPPWFLYCNPDAQLTRSVARFFRVAANPAIRRLCLDVGPMGLSGSTRMQASTVLQLAIGAALFCRGRGSVRRAVAAFRELAEATEYWFIARFAEREAALYGAGDRVTYRVADFGITVFTDTTERAPTFSLMAFERNGEDRSKQSLCYIALEEAGRPDEAWARLLGREPRALEWLEVDARTSRSYLEGFDFSRAAVTRRKKTLPGRAHHEFRIQTADPSGPLAGIALRLGETAHLLPTPGQPDLFRHLLLKLVLNIHSTLVMGRLGRYEGNVMTWVRPSNGKLVDRAVRYVQSLLAREGVTAGYETVVRRLFVEVGNMKPDEPAVLRTWQALRREGALAQRVAPAREPHGDSLTS